MIRFKNISSPYWRNMVSRMALVIVAVVLIVLFLPRTQGKLFHYDEGKPWMYGQLIAKFDFPIFKTEAALKVEKDSITKHFQPYYNVNKTVEQKKIEQFREAYKNGIPGLSEAYVDAIAHRLHEIYEAGVIDPQQYSTLAKDSNNLIRVVTGKQAVSVPINKTYSTLGAYEQLFMDPLLGPKRSVLQQCNLNDYIEANLVYDKDRSETEMNDMLSLIPQASGMVLEGQRIIDRGDIFTLYLALFRKDYFNKPRSISLLYVMIVIYPILTSLMMEHNILSVYILPFSMAPIFFRVFMDSRTAFIGHITMVLICAVAVKYQYEFIIVQIVAGLIAIYSLRELSKRSQIFLTALLVTIGSAAVYLALQLIQADDLSKLDHTMYYHFAVNGFFLLFTYPLMLVIEKAFGFVSTVTMFELSNTNNELLRRLSEVAPGTFQHSITVGNLATEIASRIGAKSQLVRTGALYHDIGKMLNPAFFTENQAGINPHDKLNDLESARIIISHVTEGLKLAEKYNLPREIKEFITTHHGTGLAKYFYIHYKNEHPDEEVNEDQFRYPGPNPFTREQAILMMSDTVEAASRSLQEYTEESISNLVNQLIDGQVADGKFTDCPITFRDITAAKSVLIERLKAMYHTRIQYPQLKV